MTHLKICGIKSEAILPFLRQPVAYVGFIFYPPSPRFISVEVAKGLARQLAQNPKTSRIKKVGVFVDASDDFIMERAGVLDILQLHGNETPQRLSQLKALTAKPLIKALKVPKLSGDGGTSGTGGKSPTGGEGSSSAKGESGESSPTGDKGSPPTGGKGSPHAGDKGGSEGANSEVLARLQAAIKSHSKVADYLMLDGGMGQGVPFDWQLCRQLSLPSHWFLAGGIDGGNIHLAQKTEATVLDISSGVEDANGEKSPAKLTELIAKLKTAPSSEPTTEPNRELNTDPISELNTEPDTAPEAKTGFASRAIQ